ncbi:MAG: competence/damage-inducible protein A [Clostridia bacterium]|nr:competence/damage-inducible protein A [Clostridia bacterium]
MKAEIIAVGTEILLGDILNSNARFIAQELARLGITCHYQTVVGDNYGRLLDTVTLAFSRADIVITSGGLGPTDDDITKEVMADYFGRKLELHEPTWEKILKYLEGRDYIAESNKKQAVIPEGAVVFENNNGLAAGCAIEQNGKTAVILPGPPNEIIPMFKESVRPYLEKKQEVTIISHELHLSGIGESAAAEAVEELMQKSTNPTIAPYAKNNEMLFRITARGKDSEECNAVIKPVIDEIYSRLGRYIYGNEEETLESAVMKDIISRNMTVATAESCTGGMVAARLINYPGASQAFINGMVTYTDESKHRLLGVSNDTLEKYGAVSPQTAEEMCLGVAKASGTDIGLSTTGIAGPGGGTKEKPVGLVYIGVAINGRVIVKKLLNKGSRERIRTASAAAVLELLRQELKKLED